MAAVRWLALRDRLACGLTVATATTAVVDLAFAVEECAGFECLGPKLRRVVATGQAVRLAMAA